MDNNFENQPMGNMNPQPELNNQPMVNMNPYPELNNQSMGNMNSQPELNNQPMGNMNPYPGFNNQPMNNGYQQPMYNQPMNGGYDPNMYNMQPEKKSKTGLIIVLAVLFIGAVVAVLFLTGVLGGKDKDESSNSNSNSNEVSNSNSNSNEPSNSNSNLTPPTVEPNSNSNSNSNGNTGIDHSKLVGIYNYKDTKQSVMVSITSKVITIIITADGNSRTLYANLELDNSIKLSYDYSKSGYSAYNLYNLKNASITEGGKTTNYADGTILGLGLSDDGKNLHLFMSDDKTVSNYEVFCSKS